MMVSGEDAVDFGVVVAVEKSWNQIKRIDNYAEVVGEMLFRKLFELAPVTVNMYSFGLEFQGNEESLYESAKFKQHACAVIEMLDQAVNMLGPDLEPISMALTQLGARHVEYGVLTAHYAIIGKALMYTLEKALGNDWTTEVEEGWSTIYYLISTAMIAGADRHLEQKKFRLEKTSHHNSDDEHGPIGTMVAEKNAETTAHESPLLRRKSKVPTRTLLNDISDMEDLVEPMSAKRVEMNRLIDTAVNLSLDLTNNSPEKEPVASEHDMMQIVLKTWDIVRDIPNYEEVAGVLLFKKIFEIAPEAKALFQFTNEYANNEEGIYTDSDFLEHARRVVKMLDASVNMLGPDLEPLTEALETLGAIHLAYGVLPEHYPVVGEALLSTLEVALGDAWNDQVQIGWAGIYAFVSTAMIAGAEKYVDT